MLLASSKKEVALAILERTELYVHLDPRRIGVVVPTHLGEQITITLAVARAGLRIPIPDLVVDDAGIRGTLSFDEQPFACVLPWCAVYRLTNLAGEGTVFSEDVPADLPEPALHREECSFCLAPRADVYFLVVGDTASICEQCVAAHRPRTFVEVVRRWLAPREPIKLGNVVAMPYRDAAGVVCSFCGVVAPTSIVGARARICRPCLGLASETIAQQ